LVVGAGAAGLMAAGSAAQSGADVTLAEKNEKSGKKLYITGKGRCNVTNACAPMEFLEKVVSGNKFLMSAINAFSPQDTIDFLQKNGLKTVIERGNRVFPASGKSSDVISALTAYALNSGAEILTCSCVESIGKLTDKEGFSAVVSGKEYEFDKVVIATGGVSYPSTGSTGDGYRFAEKFGHSVTEPKPSLVPLTVAENYVKRLEGLSLKNVGVSAYFQGRKIFDEQGEMLFTSNGVSGPLILSLSARISRMDQKAVGISVDLKPALTEEMLDNRLLRDFSEAINKQFKNALDGLLPKSLIPVIVELSGISPEQKVHQITKENRKNLVNLIKNLKFSVIGNGGFNQAVITSGGVSLKEINPKTMESKLVKGLYFAGEVLDLDALTGGYNIQIALSTGRAAGIACAILT
ncbi:MAG TPA: NAD(P)/FAD-dependent oxidoreductase, partial [Candidatus Faecicola pullistercoris]|nr:NAD(P)/FAD-dependent oxidoreductase [Candidatus Faecicola pullistercoris]